jgi:hypothetical protein
LLNQGNSRHGAHCTIQTRAWQVRGVGQNAA